MSNSEVYFPFGSITPAIVPQVIPYDLVIQEAYPGLVLAPTEPDGVYSVLREVSGCTWWVLNADFNDNTERWEQDSPTNAVLPAYALEQCQSGTLIRYVAAPTVIPGNAITWIPVWTIDANGFQTIAPQTATQASQVADIVDVTWNAGTSSTMVARETNVVDSSSADGSLVDDVSVNSTPVWQVRKDGTLVTGIIPFARITGYTPPTTFNNATFTGTTTFNGPVQANDGLTVTGGISADTINVTGSETVGGNLHVVGSETIDGNLTVTGTTTLPAGTIPVTNITGSGGVVVTHTGTTYNADGSALVTSVTSTSAAITATRTGQNVQLAFADTVVPGNYYPTNVIFRAGGTLGGSGFIQSAGGQALSANYGNGAFIAQFITVNGALGQQSYVQHEYGIKVQPGAGTQTISGFYRAESGSGSPVFKIGLGTATVYSNNAQYGNFTFTVPDDGNEHYLIYSITANAGGGPGVGQYMSNWVPTLAVGGLDTTKFAKIGTPSVAYPF
jgi:hypothetical protein